MKKILFLLILFVIPLVYSQPGGLPSIPDRFIGTIKINDVDAPIGTEIIVKVDDVLDDTYITTIAGSYDIYAKIGSSGDAITFFINETQADQLAEERTGGTTSNLDLTFSITTTVPSSRRSSGGSRRRTPTTTIPYVFPQIPVFEPTEEKEGVLVIGEEEDKVGMEGITGVVVGAGEPTNPIVIFSVMLGIILIGSFAYFFLFRKK